MKKSRKPDFISLKEKDKENCRSNKVWVWKIMINLSCYPARNQTRTSKGARAGDLRGLCETIVHGLKHFWMAKKWWFTYIMIEPFCIMFNVYYIQDLLKLLMSVLVDDKMLWVWVVKFFSVSPSVMYGTVMKWLGQAVYSCTADMCTVQLPVYTVQPGNFHPHLSGQSGAGERAGRRAEPCSVRGRPRDYLKQISYN